MNYNSILRILSFLGLIQSALLLLAASVALALSEWEALLAFGLALFFVSVVSTSLLLLIPKPTRRATSRDGLGTVLLWWVLASASGVLPFIFHAPPGAVLLVWHEVVSSLTMTGHAVLPLAREDWPVSLIVWRGLLHLAGAMASLVTAASVFAALNLGGPGIHRTVLFTQPEGSFFEAIPRVAVAAALALFSLTLVVFISLAMAGLPLGLALADAVSVATTGLVLPGRAEMAPLSGWHGLIMFVGLVLSTIGLAAALEARAGRWRAVLRDPEGLTFLVMVLVIVAAMILAGHGIFESFGLTVSQQSTAGLPLSDPAAMAEIPLPVLLLPTLVGGAALSTAGGIKLARLALLVGRAGEEVSRLGYRDALVTMHYRDRTLKESAVIGVWVYLVAYTIVVATGLGALAFVGLDFEPALSTTIGLLSNAGNLVAIDADAEFAASHLIASVLMILGRLEVIALLPALSLSFWRG